MIYNKTSRRGKNKDAISATVEQIMEYRDNVVKGLIDCILSSCPRCGLEPEYFKRHEARKRKFHVVLEQIVNVVAGLLIRWKCPGCNKTFTQYPDFALPHKRYTLPTIMHFCTRYTEQKNASYRKVLIETPLFHPNSDSQMDNHTTVHRWIASLGGMKTTVANSIDLILQADPLSSVCRDLANISISPKKYRSSGRKSLLILCRQLFHIETSYRKTFNISIFPKLATNCRFT